MAIFLFLFVFWLLFNGRITWDVVAFGLVISGFVTWFAVAICGWTKQNTKMILYLSGQIIHAVIHPNDGISQMAHIVGGICGTAFGWALAKPKEPKAEDSTPSLPTV